MSERYIVSPNHLMKPVVDSLLASQWDVYKEQAIKNTAGADFSFQTGRFAGILTVAPGSEPERPFYNPLDTNEQTPLVRAIAVAGVEAHYWDVVSQGVARGNFPPLELYSAEVLPLLLRKDGGADLVVNQREGKRYVHVITSEDFASYPAEYIQQITGTPQDRITELIRRRDFMKDMHNRFGLPEAGEAVDNELVDAVIKYKDALLEVYKMNKTAYSTVYPY